jgi:hypothetical protein
MTDKQIAALGILAAGALAAAYLAVKKPGQSLASSVASGAVNVISDAISGAADALKDTSLGQGVTDIVNHHDAMTIGETLYYHGLSNDDTWQGEERSAANAALNEITFGAWGAGWFGLFD